jgi:methylmalonyl-CoA/ethylmalonyl-CoA epimerase
MQATTLTAIGQIMLPVQDIARATRFYRDVLGLKLLFEVPGMTFFECGGIRLMLSRPDGATTAGASVLYYRVQDAEATYQALTGSGASAVEAPHMVAKMPNHELWMGFLKDSEGNTFAVMAEKPLTQR